MNKKIGTSILVDELREISQPEDEEFFEYAHQSSFVGTPLKLMLERAGVKTIILCGIHLDWCIEGNARAARDEGYIPIVIGDACSCQNQEDDVPAMNRINNIVCPVLSADQAVSLVLQGRGKNQGGLNACQLLCDMSNSAKYF